MQFAINTPNFALYSDARLLAELAHEGEGITVIKREALSCCRSPAAMLSSTHCQLPGFWPVE